MPMTTQSSSVLPDASSGSAPEEGWLSGLHVSGFLSQTFGMWQNSENLRQYTDSRNSLAVSRTWLQVDENYRLDENNNFFMREWFVYEPPYAYNSANGFGKYWSEPHRLDSSQAGDWTRPEGCCCSNCTGGR
jgi:hypothetical protein